VDQRKLEQVKNECREIVSYIHYKVDPSIEYYMEKNGVYIDEDVKYFSWSENASVILRLRKEMINEGRQTAEGSMTECEEEKRVQNEYEKLIQKENDMILLNIEFRKIMNLYMKHSQYMDRRYKYIYEDDYLPILNLRRNHFYDLEIFEKT
jgi:hypothetical protein